MNAKNDRILFPEFVPAHSVAVQIRFADYDSFGHINNNAYMAYFDLGKSEFLCHIMNRRCAPSDLAAAIVNINVDFLQPSTLGQPLEVRTGVVRLGERSFTLYQQIVDPRTGHVKAQALSVLAGFDIASQSAGPLKPELARNLRSCLPEEK